jgi:hypothetical protein
MNEQYSGHKSTCINGLHTAPVKCIRYDNNSYLSEKTEFYAKSSYVENAYTRAAIMLLESSLKLAADNSQEFKPAATREAFDCLFAIAQAINCKSLKKEYKRLFIDYYERGII